MGIRLSHSSKNTFLTCPRKYRLHYVERYRSVLMSSALLYGSAMDNALNLMLEQKDNPNILEMAKKEFAVNWEQGESLDRKSKIDLPLNPNIKYYKKDWEPDLLDKSDWKELFKYDPKFFDTKGEVDNLVKEKVDWLDIPEQKRSIVNYAHWLMLQKKANLMLEAYYTEILPHIKTVLKVQFPVELDDGEGNILNGVLDNVSILQNNKIAIVDNKTSSEQYDQDSVRRSEQLATYYKILNIHNEDPEHEWKHKIDCAAFAVLVKDLDKTVTKKCESCGHIATGTHKTCDKEINGKRCNGKWDKDVKFKVITQFIVGDIDENFADEVFEDASQIKSCIEQGLFPKNLSSCDNQYGQRCPFYSKCHGGPIKGLVQLPEKK